jgi:hypothetical protein
MGRRALPWVLLGVLAGVGGFRLYHCRHIECDSLVNCTGKWGQEVKCGAGHKFKCPSPPPVEGE